MPTFSVVTEDVPEGATMVGTKARSTLVAAETWQRDFIPYGTPCKEPCEPGGKRFEDLEAEVAELRELIAALQVKDEATDREAKVSASDRKRTRS